MGDWQGHYSPLAHVNPSIYNGLLDPPSFDEVKKIIIRSPVGKAAGPNGLPMELYKHADDSILLLLTRVFKIIMEHGLIPDIWLATNIFTISKKGDFNGDLNNLRPITLIDSGRKLFSSLLTRRLMNILEKENVLKGLNFGGKPGSQALDSVHLLQTCIEDAKLSGLDLQVLCLDIRRAFDSVPFSSLEAFLKRLHLPQGYIRLIMTTARERQVRLITRYGLTDSIRPCCGIEQGEVNAPLLWRIFYDPLLVRLAEMQEGYCFADLELPIPPRRVDPDLTIPAYRTTSPLQSPRRSLSMHWPSSTTWSCFPLRPTKWLASCS